MRALACRSTLISMERFVERSISAFGGVLVTNTPIDKQTAEEVNKLFFEIIIAPSFEKNTLDILKIKKNRIILQYNFPRLPKQQFRSILNGVLEQEKDLKIEKLEDMKVVNITTG
jgi:phosphoribosylaminoimidazolecarboxamide formyltransferase/IMP cyclohydrolase